MARPKGRAMPHSAKMQGYWTRKVVEAVPSL